MTPLFQLSPFYKMSTLRLRGILNHLLTSASTPGQPELAFRALETPEPRAHISICPWFPISSPTVWHLPCSYPGHGRQ